jgi:quercetin dioxygenase-like cupin family protein
VTEAEVVLFCADVNATLPLFTERLGFRLDSIFPADDPSVATLSGHGLRVRLERGAAVPARALPEVSGAAPWVQGRAGMRYRDLIPDRLGGRFIASHIQIPDAGPVADYVHFHEIRFQMIYCHRGWVRVVYEDQGPPFVLHPGDCVLQPPGIRHRVLEAAAGTEVIEISSPAQHVTYVEHEMELPTATERRDRVFGGQRFVRHEAVSALWGTGRRAGFESRDTGIGQATGGLAEAHVLRRRGPEATKGWSHDGELLFVFVLSGAATLRGEGRAEERLVDGDSCVVPAGTEHTWAECEEGVELLEVVVTDPLPQYALSKTR